MQYHSKHPIYSMKKQFLMNTVHEIWVDSDNKFVQYQWHDVLSCCLCSIALSHRVTILSRYRLSNLPAAVENMTFNDTKNCKYFCNGYDNIMVRRQGRSLCRKQINCHVKDIGAIIWKGYFFCVWVTM